MILVSDAGVLKISDRAEEARRLGDVLRAFDGVAVVRPGDVIDRAVLMERLRPGHSAAELVAHGRDDEATAVVADVIRRMSPRMPPDGTPTVLDLASAFRAYRPTGDARISSGQVDDAERVYVELCDSQRDVRLLHGDLHQGNILFDDVRGWVAIDPKGVVGEVAYEVGASLRNPVEHPEIVASATSVKRRLQILEAALGLDATRMIRWAYAQAVLAAIWLVEDEGIVDARHPFLAFAATSRAFFP
jgi:streptomycin 6-kinase